MEAQALRAVFGADLDAVPMSCTKALTGQALGATGAIEAAICALALHHGRLPPTANIAAPNPACALPFIGGDGLERLVDSILSNSFGFGGLNVALVFRRYPAAGPQL